MGENRIIWIPKALCQMVKDYENRQIIITINELVGKEDNDTGNRKKQKQKKNNNKQR